MRFFWFVGVIIPFFSFSYLQGQGVKRYTSSEIHHEIQKLNFLGTALYVAAHPDDENTRLISYLANHVKASTTYLSLTRGDGGQNLIGPELREQLGILRTQELLGARRVDGGRQRFTRANDFGYSKHPGETMEIWDKEQVLADVVKTIRQLKPDIVINRFDHRTPGTTHGHHTASAMLSHEAFDLANDPKAYPTQLNELSVWEPKRLFFNTSWWFYGSRENFEKADKSKLSTLDVGVYYPNLGLSNNEISSLASSQHKCQGFGRLLVRGTQPDYVELLKGEPLMDKSNLFDGINTTWTRVAGGDKIGAVLNKVEANFDFKDPSVHLPDLLEAYELLRRIEDDHWRTQKLDHLTEIILACGGIYLEASAKVSSAVPGETISIALEMLNRNENEFQVESLDIGGSKVGEVKSLPLLQNKKEALDIAFTIPQDTKYSTPYWLEEQGSLGMYIVNDKRLIGEPETPEAFQLTFELNIDGTPIRVRKPLIHRFSKPDYGEVYEPFVVLPRVTADFDEAVVLFTDSDPKEVVLAIRAGVDKASGSARLAVPEGWASTPMNAPFSIAQKGGVQRLTFKISPPVGETTGTIAPLLSADGQTFDKKLVEIAYDHIPKQSVLLPTELRVVRMDIKKEGERIGYIQGAGDKVPESLSQIGYKIDVLDVGEIEMADLLEYDGIVLGIRAYNVIEELKYKQNLLFDYVAQGGNMIVQYNTAGRWRTQFENIAPYPLTISRDRVTDENAAVGILAKNHEVINHPNKIGPGDFDGWVQERGLYFPNEWDDRFTPILSMSDKGEEPKQGSLLVAPYGKGNYIYTGLSFFRELPAGIPGAYKLFANMLSLKSRDGANKEAVKG